MDSSSVDRPDPPVALVSYVDRFRYTWLGRWVLRRTSASGLRSGIHLGLSDLILCLLPNV